MAILPIVTAPDERLGLYSTEVEKIDEFQPLMNDMLETMHHTGGIGLAAVQVGVHKRIFVMDVKRDWQDTLPNYQSKGKFYIINPRIMDLSKEQISLTEGCLSLKEQGNQNQIMRSRYLTLKYLDYDGKEQTLNADGWLARCIQHELDHLNGVIFLKHLLYYF